MSRKYGQKSKDIVMQKMADLGYPITYISQCYGYWAQVAQDCDTRWESSTDKDGYTRLIRCPFNVSECARKELKVVPYESGYMVEIKE